MYLESIALKNVGPISDFNFVLPFADGLPKPVVLVGPNGCGKSTVLSFIVNALVAFKQQVFEEAEVAQNRVYRVRGGLFLRGGENYYHAKLQFVEGLSLEEWVLDRTRKRFEEEVNPLPVDQGWRKIAETAEDLFVVTPNTKSALGRQPNPVIEKQFSENVVLFFPSDRFEPPDWLNEKSLSTELKFPEVASFVGFTDRRIFSRSLLKPTLEWLQNVAFDWMLGETRAVTIPVGEQGRPPLEAFVRVPGPNSRSLDAARLFLGKILGVDATDVQMSILPRNARRFSASISRGDTKQVIPSLLGLSAGQGALFCLFCNIVRDFDLSEAKFEALEGIRGIVVIDEADLHLHMDLQYRVLPELMRLFPKVQFIVTAQSPFFALGMRQIYGDDGFSLIQLPDARSISAEAYSEFRDAFDTFRRTSAFENQLLAELRGTSKPVVLCEGKIDVAHLNVAWNKLHPGVPNPFQIVGCGGDSLAINRGGVKTLKAMLEALAWFEDRVVIGVFDNDRLGAEQFNSLQKAGFEAGANSSELKHRSKGVNALLIPTPTGRELFVPAAIRSRVLELEHYYADSVLGTNGLVGDSLYGSPVFEIRDGGKLAFTTAIQNLAASEFTNFQLLFDRLSALAGLKTTAEASPAA